MVERAAPGRAESFEDVMGRVGPGQECDGPGWAGLRPTK